MEERKLKRTKQVLENQEDGPLGDFKQKSNLSFSHWRNRTGG